MPEIGQSLSHYSIVEKIGKGGMGEVFRAKDQVLGRDVAIKVLPEEFARDADRVARFQREAKLLASLNHPNIAAIHGLEESSGTQFLVLELVEGETLADRIKAGAVPVEEALKLAFQIAEALEAAHEKGVIHRDLKPANIKVTPDGKVKVLDFGLAKAYAGDREEVNLSNSPTLSDAATQQGVILGTAAYMSPEQARGKAVDKRADIWAFGCVLYEMLAGHAAFSGRDVTDILAAVIRSDPEWKSLPANLHWRLLEVLERCLEKEAKDRYSGINDARVEIRKILADPGGVSAQSVAAAEPRIRLRTIIPWAAAALVLGLIVAGVAVWNLRKPEPRQVIRLEHYLPDGQQLNDQDSAPALAVSPDGKQFVYSTPKGLFLRSVDELTARLIAGTEANPMEPFFSPDGKWIAYYSPNDFKLKKISVNGGSPVALCDVQVLLGASWGADNTIVYGQLLGDIMQISADGGTPKLLVKAKSELLAVPQILPDGESLLYTSTTGGTDFRIRVHSLVSGDSKDLFPGVFAQYLPTGHMIYMLPNSSTLFSVPFDLGKLDVKGGPVPIVEGVQQYAVSESGTLVYIPGATAAAGPNERILVWVDKKGKETPIAASPNDYRNPRISPDGTKVALTINSGDKSDIWIWDLARETMTRLTFNEASRSPLWTLDARRIAYFSVSGDKFGVYWKAADGTGGDEMLGSAPDRAISPWSWSKDGKTIALLEAPGGLNWDIGSLSMEGDHKRKPLLQEKYIELQPKISPDGKWLAYGSDESGSYEIYVRPFPDVNKGRWQVSTNGGDSPLWSPDGRELFYRNGDFVVAVSVETEPAFKCGKPMSLFQGKYQPLSLQDAHPWDISPDGSRFLMMKSSASAGAAPAVPAASGPRPKINIVLNWTEELKQRVPVK